MRVAEKLRDLCGRKCVEAEGCSAAWLRRRAGKTGVCTYGKAIVGWGCNFREEKDDV
jgi:hypothetical protein